MTFGDILHVCLQNLMRRKVRTMLTVLGVLVGCSAIVMTVSMGIGMKEAQKKLLAEMGDLTVIDVSVAANTKSGVKLDDEALKTISKIENVLNVTPKLSTNILSSSKDPIAITLYAGNNKRYSISGVSITGMEKTGTEDFDFKLEDGRYPDKNENEVLVGELFAYNFVDSMRPAGHNTIDVFGGMTVDENGTEIYPDPFFDILKTPIQMEIKIGGKTTLITLQPVGVLKLDYSKGEETSMGVIMDLHYLKKIVDEAKKEAGVSTTQKNVYSSFLVKVNDIAQVKSVENQIKQLGYSTSSMENIREPLEKEAKQRQMLLGGLGSISLFVAALGIMNTMIMSISERTREIGVMKALGCQLNDIRMLFLMEAGVIGFLGGIIGCIISIIIGISINKVTGETMSIIPAWLLLFGIVFSIIIGILSGWYPSNKAVNIPALEAIKHD